VIAALGGSVNAETDVRGYAATGDPLFLVPYNLMPPLAADRSIKISQDRPWADLAIKADRRRLRQISLGQLLDSFVAEHDHEADPAPRTVPAP
jgi:hypothetical protein